MIKSSATKLEDIGLTRQSSAPMKPTMTMVDTVQHNTGITTQRNCLKKTAKAMIKNKTTPTENLERSFLIKESALNVFAYYKSHLI